MVVVIAAALALSTVGWPNARAQTAGRGFEAVFRVDLDAAEIQVELTIAPESGVDELVLEVHPGAQAIQAEADGEPIATDVVQADEYASWVGMAFPATTQEIAMRYSIPSGPPRVGGEARVNPAHISFSAWVDVGIGTGSVRVELPSGFRGASYGGQLTLRSEGSDGQVWMVDRIDAAELWTEFIARNDAGLSRSVVPVGDHDVAIAGWSDDEEWIAFAEDTVGWAVPMLVDLIGQPWPDSDLVVIESTEPNAAGYAGWYSVWESEIAVDDSLNVETMVHELAHAWFNYLSFEDRWLVEGLAEDFATLAVSRHLGTTIEPAVPEPELPGSSELAGWTPIVFWDGEAERNAYSTSWYVLKTIREEIGTEAMVEVLAAALEGRRSYHVPGDAATRPANTTERFLDLVENVGGSTIASDLLSTYVFSDSRGGRLQLREEARSGYEALRATGFQVPVIVRDYLEDWKFELAIRSIDTALPLATRLAELETRAGELDTQIPASAVAAYETARTGFAAAERELASVEVWLDGVEGADPSEGVEAAGSTRGRDVAESGGLWSLAGGVFVVAGAALLILTGLAVAHARSIRFR